MFWYFVRHGETEWNKERLFQGATDVPLNDTGRDQAREAASRIQKKGISFKKVYSSPLGRAIETAELITGIKRDEFVIDERIKEMFFGELEGTDYDLVKAREKDLFAEPQKYVNCERKKGVETYDNIVGRAGDFIAFLKTQEKNYGPDDNILIQTHGACMRALLINLRGTALKDFWNIKVGNCEFFCFELKNGVLTEISVDDLNINAPGGIPFK
ncbi:probable phosphoglycerate mutase [Butyrivibrio fibrisolvens DSM 3071]|uniref:Probable phosphoglycerate mutase n=1 Tax=Butyrivibrio fibrisolvens DSM 3071 TaxID=1121131 RepID=A0A1M5X3G5_BUTFI|nr:histidine phosphatase family protein [Butyrivibrio fibrisolvens]SHH94044.1 probable phosphoglycerate mutase [Butyrivibrio fibrisolvens DSM 3071]